MNAIKKTKSKRLFSMLLALMMCLTMLPTTAWAAGELTEPLNFTSATDNVAGEGYSWTAESKTLTLDGLTLNVTTGDGITLPADSKIVLSGTNTVNAGGDLIDCAGNLDISGEGSLTGKVTTVSDDYAGIRTNGGSLTITDSKLDLTINPQNSTAPTITTKKDNSSGGSISLLGSANVTTRTATQGKGWALCSGAYKSSGDILIGTGASFTAVGLVHAMYAGKGADVTINGILDASACIDMCANLLTYGSLTINGTVKMREGHHIWLAHGTVILGDTADVNQVIIVTTGNYYEGYVFSDMELTEGTKIEEYSEENYGYCYLYVADGVSLTIPEDKTLTMKSLKGNGIDGPVVNNGTLNLPEDTTADAIKVMNLTGNGLVKVSEDTYLNDGTKINIPAANDPNLDENGKLDLSTAAENKSGNGYNWDAADKILTLNNFYFDGTIILPSEATVITETASSVDTICMNCNDFNAKKLTLSGSAPLTLRNLDCGGQAAEVTVSEGAEVKMPSGINIGTSGGINSLVTVNGKLTASNYYDAAISCGKVVIGSTGELKVSGKQGVRVNGMNPSGDAADYTGIFTVENGGKFIANCTDYNVMAFTSRNELTEDTVKQVIVLPDNYLPDDYAIRMVSGKNGEMQYAATIAKTDAELTLESESVSGAGGALTLSKKSSGGGSHSGGGGSHSGGGGSSSTSYTITASAGENGSIAPDGKTSVTKNTDKTFTITPNSGYAVEDVLVDGKSVGAVTTYTFTKVTAAHTISATFKAVAQTGYTDVDTDDWFYDGVQYVTDKGLMNGTGNGAFSPSRTLTRGMFVTILYRMEGSPVLENYGYPYGDVQADTNVYAPGIYWARANKIVTGYTDDKFGTNDPVTREQMAAILYRYAQYKGYDVSKSADLTGFADANSISGYALTPMQWANAVGLITGTSATTLSPVGNTTRSQAAVIIHRFCENIAD